MLSIGELAQRTGTTPRMLRHWQAMGLLPAAGTDPATGRRSYDPVQEGRVQTIVALRANGFGLDAIRDLLDSRTDHERLRAVLDARRSTLTASIARDNAALRHLDRRLASLDRGRAEIAATLRFEPLPPLTGDGVRAIVSHESEIPAAVRRLLQRLDAAKDVTTVLVYDGTTDPRVIEVTALAHPASEGGLSIPGTDRGVIARLGERPVDLGDTWTALDAEILSRGLTTTGPYRQILHPDGTTTLAAPTEISPGSS